MSDPIRFEPDRFTYVRSLAWLAAVAMAGGMGVLWLIGSAHVWTGAVAGLLAVTLRGWYLSGDELKGVWVLEGRNLIGPNDRCIPVSQIATVRKMFNVVQIATRSGDTYLIKYQADPGATARAIERAAS